MRLVRDVFTPIFTFPIAANSTAPAFLLYFSAGRMTYKIYPVLLFFGPCKQLILAVTLFLKYTLFSGDHTEAVPGAGVFGIWQAAWIWILDKIVLKMPFVHSIRAEHFKLGG